MKKLDIIKIYVLLQAMVLIPIVIISLYFINSKVNEKNNFDNENIVSIREQKILDIKENYKENILDDRFFHQFIGGYEEVEFNIVDSNFKIISSTDEKKKGTTYINKITKDMLDGKKGIGFLDGKNIAYGFIDFGDATVFITVEKYKESTISYIKGDIVFVFFITILSLIGAFVLGWKILKFYRESIKSIEEKKGYDSNKWMQEKLEISFDELMHGFEGMRDFEKKVYSSYNRIKDIKNRIEEGDEYKENKK